MSVGYFRRDQRNNGRERPKYQQPHNLDYFHQFFPDNPALAEHMIDKEHGRQKYAAKYIRSKQSRRLPD